VPNGDRSGQAPSAIAHLTGRLAAGEEAAFREFHAVYFDRLYQFLLGVTRGDRHAAGDAIQEAMLRVARHARRFEDEEIFWGWLRAIARNAARDGNRKQRRYLARLKEFALGFHRPALAEVAEPAPDDLRGLLQEILSDLSPSDRELIEGKYFRGETVAELAVQNDATEKAIESRLARLRQQLGAQVQRKLRSP